MTTDRKTLVTECLWSSEIVDALDAAIGEGSHTIEARVHLGQLETRRLGATSWTDHGTVWDDEQAASVVAEWLATSE